MNRIALISYHAPKLLSAESILVGKTVRRLAENNLIDVITAKDDPDFRQDEQLGALLAHPNVTVYAYPTYRPANKAVRRLADKFSLRLGRDAHQPWIQGVLRNHNWNRGYQVLYSRSQPGASHLAAHAVRQRLRIPWVAGFSDPWAYNPYHPGSKQVQKREAAVVHSAEALIFPTAEIVNLMREHYPEVDWDGKAHVIPHCFETELYPDADPAAPVRQSLTLAYIGDFYGLRSPEPLCAALSRLAEDSPQLAQKLNLTIAGNIEAKFRTIFAGFQSRWPGELSLMGQVPYMQSLAVMRQADILVLVDAPSSVNLFLPSKLIDYFGAKRPIVGITPLAGTTAGLLRHYGHQVAAPDDVPGIVNAISAVAMNFQQEKQRAAEISYEPFTAERIAGTLDGIFQTVISKQ